MENLDKFFKILYNNHQIKLNGNYNLPRDFFDQIHVFFDKNIYEINKDDCSYCTIYSSEKIFIVIHNFQIVITFSDTEDLFLIKDFFEYCLSFNNTDNKLLSESDTYSDNIEVIFDFLLVGNTSDNKDFSFNKKLSNDLYSNFDKEFKNIGSYGINYTSKYKSFDINIKTENRDISDIYKFDFNGKKYNNVEVKLFKNMIGINNVEINNVVTIDFIKHVNAYLCEKILTIIVK